ncbi:MAG: hypothetical protein ABR534_06610 [Desulfotignum sp.]|nr:hypothetical protein [Desulfobacteraceae bacterium]
MNCKDFLIWLQDRTIHNQPEDPEVLDHIHTCETCNRLYCMDNCLEACIQKSFSLQKLPHGLAQKINQHIDHAFYSRHQSLDQPAGLPRQDLPVKK